MDRFVHLGAWCGILVAAVLVACGAPDEPAAPIASETPTPSLTPLVSDFSSGGSVASLPSPTSTPLPASEMAVPDASGEETQVANDAADGGGSYVVTNGDTLLDLAMRFEVPMAAIQLHNDLGASHIIQVGQSLVIPSADAWSSASPYWMLHEVGPGETLGEIANAYDLSQQDILAVNDFVQPDLLSIGQPIVLPLGAPRAVVAAQPPTAVPQPTSTTAPTQTPVQAAAVSAAAVESAATSTPLSTPTLSPTVPPPAESPPDMAALAQETFRLINEQRAIYGRDPLAWNATLAAAAQRHAEDCHQRGWCGHTGSDGSSMKTRIIRAGYDPVRWSECWAWYRSPALAVAMWMDEVPPNDPHRRTILATHLTEVGVGVMPGNGHGYYFIADFGKPRAR